MWEDPIVKETRRLREEYAAEFNGDTKAILEDILKRQSEHEERLVSFPLRASRVLSRALLNSVSGNVGEDHGRANRA